MGTYPPAKTWYDVYSNLLPREGYLKIKPTSALSLLNAFRVVYFSPSLLEKLLHGVLRKVTNVSVVFPSSVRNGSPLIPLAAGAAVIPNP